MGFMVTATCSECGWAVITSLAAAYRGVCQNCWIDPRTQGERMRRMLYVLTHPRKETP